MASLLNRTGFEDVDDGSIQPSVLIAGLFTERVSAFETRGPVDARTLAAEEAEHVARAVPKRVGEFAAGRACARRALRELGIKDFALRVGPDRAPLWPPLATGSITHTSGFCGAVVARRTELAAVGIDPARRDAVHRRLWPRIALPQEIEWLEGLPPERAGDMATLLFSVREAFYKCQFALTREWLDFGDVSVSIGPAAFQILPRRTLALEALAPPPWGGRDVFEGGLILTGCGVPGRSV
jgi:4'-phosphopantetheinyl transferase EntD